MQPFPIFIVSAALFCIGLAGILMRRNALAVVLSSALMFNAAALNIAGFARLHGNSGGELFALFALVFAAFQVGVGLAIVIGLYRQRGSTDLAAADSLKW